MLRTHTNNELDLKHLDQEVTLCGWVSTLRDHGGLSFIDLRDRWGVTQLVFNPDKDKALHKTAQSLRSEFCIAATGRVKKRPQGTTNPKLPSGEIEVEVTQIKVFSKSKTPPFEIDTEEKLSEDVRLKYRYLDLRRRKMLDNLEFRSRLIHETRSFFQTQEFIEVDTPVLTKSTPEGARDYLVPSRVNQGEFFALPQSPQLFKQILMVAGYDRYFQIAKCFRDEDLRADRQPEFTQLDLELSFVTEEDVFDVIERWVAHICETVVQQPVTTPFPRYSYDDVMNRYGSDKPDVRFGLEIRDLSQAFENTSLKIFKETVARGGVVLGLQAPQAADKYSRKDLDELIAYAKECGASGLAYVKVTDSGVESPIAKFLSADEVEAMKKALPEEAKAGDLIFFAADQKRLAQTVLGAVRLKLGKKLNLIPAGGFSWAWVNQFPLLQYNEEEKRWDSEHHPFTGVHPDDVSKLGKDNSNIRSLSYDLVLNANEIASGSIRIHDADIQRKIFSELGLDAKEAQSRFGFLLRAFEYGPPPHGGIAIGLDRLIAILLGRDSIREVIAFPKTQRAICPMTDAPSLVDAKQLKELGIKIA